MQNPKDPRFAKPGNRLFRNAAMQRQSRTKISWQMVALAVTVLFTSAGATFYYFSQHEGAPAKAAAPAPTPEATPAGLIATPSPSPTPTPTPSPTPQETPKAKSASKKSNSGGSSTSNSGNSASKTKAKATKTKSAKTTPPSKEILTTAHKLVEPGEVAETQGSKKNDSDRGDGTGGEVKSRSTDKADSKPRSEAKGETRTKSAKTKSAASNSPAVPLGEPQAPEPKETPRPRFNMRPESMTSANTDRVSKTEEFPSDPTPAPGKAAGKASKDESAPAVPLAPSKKGDGSAKKAKPESDGMAGDVKESSGLERGVGDGPAVAADAVRDRENRLVENHPLGQKNAAPRFPIPAAAYPPDERPVRQPL